MDTYQLNKQLVSQLSTVLFIPTKEIIKAANFPVSTWYQMMNNLDSMTIQQLISISNGLHIPIRLFFSTGKTDLIKKREDYIAEPYFPCYYDGSMLEKLFSSTPSLTWKKASEVAGVTPLRLRNAMIGSTRTRIDKLLLVCNGLRIDPFTIIIDPNTATGRKEQTDADRPSGKEDEVLMEEEIRSLGRKVGELSQRMSEMSGRMALLLDEQRRLRQQLADAVQGRHAPYSGYAAEPDLVR